MKKNTAMEIKMKIEAQFDIETFTMTYIVFDEKNGGEAIIIDPVLNYEPQSSSINYSSINKADDFLKQNNLTLKYILETHAHADHISGSQELKMRYPNSVLAINENITKVQGSFKPIFNLKDLKTDGSQFDLLLTDGQILKFGAMELKVIFTPGHTPACTSFLVEDNLFVGDAIFMPDFGTGRCDFPAGSADDLYTSVHEKIYKLPDETKLFVGHDYQPGGRDLEYMTTISQSKESNIQLKAHTTREQYVEFRTTRDATLNTPKLLLPSIQVNIDAGKLPTEDDNGTAYLRLPISIK
jgi:glyoxylase-like metal-dependent hydrolase (beta-lactamase superfamily II)